MSQVIEAFAEEMVFLVTEFLSAITWPIAVIVVAVIFRRSISSLLDRILEVDAKGVKIKFQRVLQEAKEGLLRAGEEPEAAPSVPAPVYDPVAEVVSSWTDVEEACGELLRARAISVPKTFRALGSRLKRNNLIDEEHGLVLDRLRQLRNMAVHHGGNAIGVEEAKEFSQLAESMVAYLTKRSGEDGSREESDDRKPQ